MFAELFHHDIQRFHNGVTADCIQVSSGLPTFYQHTRTSFALAFFDCYIVTLGRPRIQLARSADLTVTSAIISFHCETQPMVRATAKLTVNILVGIPNARNTIPE